MLNKKISYTCIQILLKALKKIYKNIDYINSELTEDNFYLDFISESHISINDFPKIEKEMKRIISSGNEIKIIKKLNEKLKYEKYISNFSSLVYLSIGNDFESVSHKELCENVNKVKSYKLKSIGGTIYKINNKNINAIRIYAVAFQSQDELKEWEISNIDKMERDHRKIGEDMKIFFLDEMIGQGLPVWLPNGEILKNLIKNFLIDLFLKNNFNLVDTPILGNKELYVKSGHWDHYKDNNFPPIKIDNETYMLRPMTCPHHIIIFNNEPKSYKQMPYLICENSKLHRYESSGGLIGLERVRAMELFDCHIFTDKNDIENIICKLNDILNIVYKKMEIKIDEIHLSFHDPKEKEKYHNDSKMWSSAESQLKSIAEKLGYKTKELKGEAAFYGPKIDFQVKTNLGKIITISTIQLDFLLPNKFDCKFTKSTNEKEIPVLIHFGVIGTYERFISTLLSQTKGVLPFWLASVQIEIFPINNNLHLSYSKEVEKILKSKNYRVKLNFEDERLSKKIRESQIAKIPYQIIIGDNETNNKNLSIRKYSQENTETMSIEEFISLLEKKM